MIGKQITGVSFRTKLGFCDTSSSFSYTIFDIYLAPAVPAGSFSTIFANNLLDGTKTLVRSGDIALFPPWIDGEFRNIMFQTSYVYTGGNLLIEFRHSGAGISCWMADTEYPVTTAGFAALYAVGNIAATSGIIADSSLAILQFEYELVCK